MKLNIKVIIISLLVPTCVANISPISVYAETDNSPLCPYLFTFKPWYCGLTIYAVDQDGKDVVKDGKKSVEIKRIVHAEVDKVTGRKYLIDPTTKNKRELNSTEVDIATFVWVIVLNVLYDLFGLTGYLAVGFIIYAGYLYLLARGELDRITKAKKTLVSAIIGLIIAVLTSSIVAAIGSVLSAL